MERSFKFPYLPMLSTVGSHYDVGYNVGLTFAENIKRFWNESEETNDILKPYGASADGQKYLKESLEVCSKNFPQYIREIRGMADGSGMAFEDIFLLNISKEIINVLSSKSPWHERNKEISGCSDILINTKDCKIVAHNEDCDPKIKPYGYLLNARIIEDGVEMEAYTSYCYPGFLPGCAFSFNRIFLNRSIIRARNMEETVELMRNRDYGTAYGFTFNVMDVKVPTTMWSVEVAPQAEESLVHVHTIEQELDVTKPCHYFHFNSFKHLKVSEIPNLNSSVGRGETAEKLPPPKTTRDAMRILGDVSNKEYPIFRTPSATDIGETIFTTVADLLANKVQFFQGNPGREGIIPVLSLSILEN